MSKGFLWFCQNTDKVDYVKCSIELAKSIKKNLKDVAKHYKAEYERLKSLRMAGEKGPLDIIEY